MAPFSPATIQSFWIFEDVRFMQDYFGTFSLPSISYIYQTIEVWVARLLAFLYLLLWSSSLPQGFPASGNGLLYNTTANIWTKEWLPVGNGYLAGKLSLIPD